MACGDDLPKENVILAQRGIKHSSGATELDALARYRVVKLDDINTMDGALAFDDMPARKIGSWSVAPLHSLDHCLRKAARRHPAEFLAVPELQAAVGRITQRVRLLQDCVENRRKVARRRIDNLQDLGGRGLLL